MQVNHIKGVVQPLGILVQNTLDQKSSIALIVVWTDSDGTWSMANAKPPQAIPVPSFEPPKFRGIDDDLVGIERIARIFKTDLDHKNAPVLGEKPRPVRIGLDVAEAHCLSWAV